MYEYVQCIVGVWGIVGNCWHYCYWLIAYTALILLFIFEWLVLASWFAVYCVFWTDFFLYVGVACVLFSVRVRFTNWLFWSFCFEFIFWLTDRVFYVGGCEGSEFFIHFWLVEDMCWFYSGLRFLELISELVEVLEDWSLKRLIV